MYKNPQHYVNRNRQIGRSFFTYGPRAANFLTSESGNASNQLQNNSHYPRLQASEQPCNPGVHIA